ncbi:hypothetical protein RB2501_06825 [Robiginitalea biformata HTCC2501]|uniref:Glutamyl-tRNA synthetase n=1 Tax=Robiginitalea biformata (strain ATCC BAA-864 / DSM 15991 / KCTC 12146 / HTCC2501) TaxID=313596 RepID=A4CI35_ROBBH|nr:hypothetical protein RB2501_06825 [Robiginitalea biformata HTCC2501]
MVVKIGFLEPYQLIIGKLEKFLTRYYLRQLLKGTFLFLFFGGLLLLLVSGLEYLLWMGSGLRRILFWALVGIELFLFFRYLVQPVLQLFRLQRGLSYKEGSSMIGRHFPEVGDRLYNLLELAENPGQSELLLASIEQRSRNLKHVPFASAVRMQDGWRYARYAVLPLLFIGALWLTGKGLDFLDSYQRVVDYRTAYEPPAPFAFHLVNPELRSRENQAFTLKVRTVGDVQPETVELVAGGRRLLMEDKATHFEYTFRPPLENMDLYFEANEVQSPAYRLEVVRVPVIDRFGMELEFPAYLQRTGQQVQGTGSITVPEGTRIRWNIATVHTDTVRYEDKDTVLFAAREGNTFSLARRVFRPTDYMLSTSNRDVSGYDKLRYRIEVIRDEFPDIRARMVRDSLEPNLAYFSGEVSDDYGLGKLTVICYPEGDEEAVREVDLDVPGGTYHTFYYTFPSGLNLESGTDYIVQFRIRDNDGLRGGKVRESEAFRLTQYTPEELRDQQLDYQNSLLDGLGKTRETQEKLQEELDAFRKEQQEKRNLEFNDQQKLKDVLNRQLKQERLMEKFSKELGENLESEEAKKDPFRELLQERLERQEIEARKNAQLMEEMQKVLDQLDKDALRERMEEIGKRQEGNRRSMEQLLELTKRYYVQEKSRQLAAQLKELAERQDILSELENMMENFSAEQQDKLRKEFDSLRRELSELEKNNQDLKQPLPWKRDTQKEEGASQDQKDAQELLEKLHAPETSETRDQQSEAASTRKKQKAAARKIRELSEALQQSAASGGGSESTAEDAEMLRQILDNLVVFSFKQETLYDAVQKLEEGAASLSGDIRQQQELRKLFEHVDDSLFALSLRQPQISEQVNKQIAEVYYNVDKGLESLSENQWYRGASYQQYVITAANELASMLAEMLESMQQSMMPGKGEGSGSDFQLPDIIQSQEELRQRMQGSQEGNSEEGSQGNQGESSGESGQGEQGEQGSEGQGEGSQGQQGQQGQGGQEGSGEQGQGNGENGKGQGQNQGQDGQDGQGSGGENGEGTGGSNGDEMSYQELFEIYKQQQIIRNRLEEQLQDMIDNSDRELAQRIAREMEQFEEEILRNGVTTRTADRMNRIQQQLMKLENASFQQGEKEERESRTSTRTYMNPITTRPEVFENEGENVEILNRQVLPLRRIYKNKIKAYFQDEDRLPQ